MIRIFSTLDLAELPEPRYLHEPFIIDGGLSVLFGPSGVFKSFISIDWALRVASTQSCVYVAGEGSSSLRKRIAAWDAHGPEAEPKIGWVTNPVNLLDRGEMGRFADAIEALNWRPGLIVFDTLSRCLAGADENSAQDVSRAIGAVDHLRSEYGCAVLLIHHTGKQDTENERGSSALRGAADISIRAKPAGHLRVRLECAKVRDAAEFDPLLVPLIAVDGSLVAGEPGTPADVLERTVRAYLAANPGASQRAVEEHVTGRAEDIRTIYRKCVPRVPPPDAPPTTKVRPASPPLRDADAAATGEKRRPEPAHLGEIREAPTAATPPYAPPRLVCRRSSTGSRGKHDRAG